MEKRAKKDRQGDSASGRSCRLEIRLNQAERIALAKRAAELGLTPTATARMAILWFTSEQKDEQ